MFKKSDFYSTLTTSDKKVWQGDWDQTLRHIYQPSLQQFNEFVSPNTLSYYLPANNQEHHEERKQILKKLLETAEIKLFNKMSSSDDIEYSTLIVRITQLHDLYMQSLDPDNEYIELPTFGASNNHTFPANFLVKNFGYGSLQFLAEKLDFAPHLIMEISRGNDQQNITDLDGREKVVDILRQKHENVFDIFADPEATRNIFGNSDYLDNSLMVVPYGDKKRHMIYSYYDFDPGVSLQRARNSIANEMRPPEFADFVYNLWSTINFGNANDPDPSVQIPRFYDIPSEYATALLQKINEEGMMEYLVNALANPTFVAALKESKSAYCSTAPWQSYIKSFRFIENLEDPEERNGVYPELIPLFQIVIKCLSSRTFDFSTIIQIKQLMGNNFEWVNLNKNHQLAINGFAEEYQLYQFFKDNLDKVQSCKVDFKGKEGLTEAFKRQQEDEAEFHGDVYSHAIEKHLVSHYEGLDQFGDVHLFLLQEADKLGLDAEETSNYFDHINIYTVNYHAWSQLCKDAGWANSKFLGVDLEKIEAVWIADGFNHKGERCPLIVSRIEVPFNGLSTLFDYLGIPDAEYKNLNIAHEGAHALHYLSDPNRITGESVYDPNSAEIAEYIGSVPESIAYAHGNLAYFYNLVKENIAEKLEEPIVQKAIQSWILSNILSSDDAALQGFEDSRQIMRRALQLREDFGVKIEDYVDKKKQRQIQKIYEITMQQQQENKNSNLLALIEEKRKLYTELQQLKKSKRETENETDQFYIQEKIIDINSQIRDANLKIRIIQQGLIVMDLDDAAEALAEGFIKEYFSALTQSLANQHEQAAPPTEDIQDQARFIMDATFGGQGQYRPLTTEILPLATTPVDRSGGYFPHLEDQKEASSIKKLIKLASKIEKSNCKIADKIDRLLKF